MPPLGALVSAAQHLLTIAFWAMIAADHAGHISVIDSEYKETGFCAATLETHAFDSYQLCLAVDMLGCLALLALWRSGKESTATVGPAASIFFHGGERTSYATGLLMVMVMTGYVVGKM